MKLYFYIFLLAAISLSAQNPAPKLNVGGIISQEDKTALFEALVTVTRDGKPFTSFLTSVNGTYFLFLEMGAQYEVSITKKGFVKKFFTISTLGVKEVKERKRFSVMIADLELIEHFPGVDYSAFNQPMNRYYYNAKTDDFEYDSDYLKQMLEEQKKIKEQKKQAIKLAQQKSDKTKKEAQLAKEKTIAQENLASETASLKALETELKNTPSSPTPTTQATSQKILTADALILNSNGKDVEALLAKYPKGVTEEVINGNHVIVIQRILVTHNQMAWVYHKKIFDWGGVACFRDGEPITELVFEQETKNKS